MIELHTMAPAWGLPTFTPFGLKLMAHMRVASLPFDVVVEHNPTRGPTWKFPWIVDDGVAIGDSAVVVEHLRSKGHDVDAWLSSEQRAVAHVVRRTVEEGLCFVLLHLRWVDEATFVAATNVALAAMPGPARSVARHVIRRRILRDLWGQGVGRLAPERVLAMGRADLDALDTLLGDKEFFLGDRPCAADASVAAFLAVLLIPPLPNELQRYARTRPRLLGYTERSAKLFWNVSLTGAVP